MEHGTGTALRPRLRARILDPLGFATAVHITNGPRFLTAVLRSANVIGTPGAFGHLGLSNVVVFADPARELVVTFLNTGKPMMDPGMVRWYWVLQRIATVLPSG